jgi:hypothetical protein
MAARAAIRKKHADLTILDPTRRPRVLSFHTNGLRPLLEESCLVNDQDGVRIAEAFDTIGPRIVANEIGLPLGPGDEALPVDGSLFAQFFGQLPTVLAFDAADQSAEITSGMPALLPMMESVTDPCGDIFNLIDPTLDLPFRWHPPGRQRTDK